MPYSYSPAPEILQYFKSVAKKYSLYKYIKLSHIVTGAVWDEGDGKWRLEIENLVTGEILTDWCHFLINGSGILKSVNILSLVLKGLLIFIHSNWKWPDIPGLNSFTGTLMHSAAWSKEYDINSKRVAVLGCGSSGVQIVPSIQQGASSYLRADLVLIVLLDVKELVTFIRTPTWITAGFAQSKAGPGGANFRCIVSSSMLIFKMSDLRRS
jgi:cation diffusion facilitator CzcD-associated flavoprotein CzcO